MSLTQEQKQEYFNRMVAGLAGQGFERAFNEKVGSCAYRAPDGKKCAIGQLIPDDKYGADLEGPRGPVLERIGALTSEEVDDCDSDGMEFFGDAQGAHDDGYTPDDMKALLLGVGEKYGLEIPPELR